MKLRARVKQAIHSYSLFGKLEEVAHKRVHAFNERVPEARARVERLEGLYKKIVEDASHDREVSPQEIDDAAQLLSVSQQRLKRLIVKRDFWRRRWTYAKERHEHWGLVLKHRRDRLRRWVLQHRGFRPYMANGKPWLKLTPEARWAIYLDFRNSLYVTSTYEGSPGDGVHATSSYHYIENQPDGQARCWDAGSGTLGPMEKAQQREARRCPRFLTEMFGPENDLAFKDGTQFTLEEGTSLETMHDNHKHECIADGAPT